MKTRPEDPAPWLAGGGRQLSFDFGGWLSPPNPKPRKRRAGFERPSQILFLALLLDAAERGRISAEGARICEALGVSRGLRPADHLHVTLLGLYGGDHIPEAVIAAVRQALDGLSSPAFQIEMDRVASFGGGASRRPVVLTGGEGVEGATMLRETLVDRLGLRGAKEAYQPHMTLAYHPTVVQEQPIRPVGWRARDFVLIQSFVGQTRYAEQGRWALAA